MKKPHDTYPIQPVPFDQVVINDDFWLPRLETNRRQTIPHVFEQCEHSGRIDNFVKAAGRMAGEYTGMQYNDSDVYKAIEAASYSLRVHPDRDLEAHIDRWVEKIAAAQEADGYLYTPRTVDPGSPHKTSGPERWSSLFFSHELYNAGHMLEAAVAHFQATGKRTFLEIAIKNADLLTRVFGPAGLHDVPGHQEIELGLVKLYGVTGDEKYLKLARFFLDERGHPHGRALQTAFGIETYMQDHAPVIEQREAVGHAVRATYMYSAMADVAAHVDDTHYVEALRSIWRNVTERKLALTGGIGARHRGESFGDDYELPNLTAYNETCAAIGNIFWNYRLFRLEGQARYVDVLERTLYNGFLSGVALNGTDFFYVNPLESDGDYRFNRQDTITRQPWFDCACCPTNAVRVFPTVSGYIYALQESRLFVNLYIGSQTDVAVGENRVRIAQKTGYPWDGRVVLTINPSTPVRLTLSLRIPGWVKGHPVPSDLYRYLDGAPDAVSVRVNHDDLETREEAGYINIDRVWQPGDVLELTLPMPIRSVISHPNVTDNLGKVALERGPIVYAVESIDRGRSVTGLVLPDDAPLSAEHRPDVLGGVTVIRGEDFFAIPYYAWSHRGMGDMAVWLARDHR